MASVLVFRYVNVVHNMCIRGTFPYRNLLLQMKNHEKYEYGLHFGIPLCRCMVPYVDFWCILRMRTPLWQLKFDNCRFSTYVLVVGSVLFFFHFSF
jgi:hypothetical protein